MWRFRDEMNVATIIFVKVWSLTLPMAEERVYCKRTTSVSVQSAIKRCSTTCLLSERDERFIKAIDDPFTSTPAEQKTIINSRAGVARIELAIIAYSHANCYALVTRPHAQSS